uniref:RRM domain-containing protein n=1 Tax=Panagrolaimus davidi TaxID=227884 RepID=A0A914P007_9BILA
MVKLFVGNLAECVDSHRLKNLFLQHVNVQECDVLKNFAFVHVATEDDATTVIEKLDKTLLEGREIHVERSTSRLRKEPGMSDLCYTCGASDHKTPQCPMEISAGRRKNIKRAGDENDSVAAAKRPNTNLSATPSTGSCWGYKLPTVVDNDPELTCPANPELKTLYEQYKDARSRYHYFRDRLQKELSLQAANGTPTGNGPVRIDLTRTQPAVSTIPTVSVAAPVALPVGPAHLAPVYRPQNYPGAAPVQQNYPGAGTAVPSVSYPGASATVYTAQPSAYGQQPIQHYSTPYSQSNNGDVKPYASTTAYQRSQNYPR